MATDTLTVYQAKNAFKRLLKLSVLSTSRKVKVPGGTVVDDIRDISIHLNKNTKRWTVKFWLHTTGQKTWVYNIKSDTEMMNWVFAIDLFADNFGEHDEDPFSIEDDDDDKYVDEGDTVDSDNTHSESLSDSDSDIISKQSNNKAENSNTTTTLVAFITLSI